MTASATSGSGSLPRSIVIVGPTASGKSALALELARLLGDSEIVSIDSMQVYRRMDIGTGKVTTEERAETPHHLLDLVEPSTEFSVSWFQSEARAVLADLAARGRRAILVGGTGLYHRAVVDDREIPGEYPVLRSELERTAAAGPEAVEALHGRLAVLDPTGASRCEPTNARRVVRALEVTMGSGRPFSSYGPGLEEYPPSDHLMVGLRVERSSMLPLIEERVRTMMAAGFLDEVRALAAEEPPLSRTARQALGYRELLSHLAGGSTEAEAVVETVVRTRQFAVRQDRWFRRDPRIEWHPTKCDGPAQTRSLASFIAGSLDST